MTDKSDKNLKSSPTNSNSNLSMVLNSPSEQSAESVFKGTRAFVWDRERSRSDQPYVDKKYHIPFNPPPNEVNFIGGLGENKGHLRSKVHPNRPTIVQKIYRMRNQNRIDVSFTQPLSETNNCVHRKKVESNPTERFNGKTLKKIVQRISLADIVETNSTASNESDASANALLARKLQQKRFQQKDEPPTADYCIDGKPFYIKKHEIRQKLNEILEKTVDRNLTISDVVTDASTTFKRWTQEESGNNVSHKILIGRQTTNNSETSSVHSSPVRAVVTTNKKRRRTKKSGKNALHHLTGYMYGIFSKPTTQTQIQSKNDRFGIPFTMIERAQKEHTKRKIQENVLRRVRLSHMGYNQPPSKDDSSDSESIQNVKRLALLRTPYFLVPTIKISQVRKKERFRNKYLQKDRLNRINLLLYDRSKKGLEIEKADEGDVDDNEIDNEIKITKKHHFFAKFFQLSTKSKIALKRDPMKEKYFKVILDKFEEQRKHCEPKDSTNQTLTFEEFKKQQSENGNNTRKAIDINSKTEHINGRDNETNDLHLDTVLKKLFKSERHTKLRNTEEIDGPLYIDPHLKDKQNNPQEFTNHCKYYTNLFKSKFGLRNRLQANGINFDYGKLGVPANKNFPRLPTEWDDYYVHEMRYRRSVKKFCVKTDILKLREMVRKNFLMYYAQENLFDLKAKQMAENRLMDDVEHFDEECSKLFSGWSEDAYNQVIAKNNSLQVIQSTNNELIDRKDLLIENVDKLTKAILLNENQWDFLLQIQNYYYLVMNTEWRQQHDWIHRDNEQKLLTPLVAIHRCAQRNIRSKAICSGDAVKQYFENEIKPNLEKMIAIRPNAELLRDNLNVLMKKSFVSLNQHNKTIWVYKEIEQMHKKLKDDMTAFRDLQEEKIKILRKRQEFMSERHRYLQANSEKLLNNDLSAAVTNPIERNVMGVIDVLYAHFVPQENLNETLFHDTSQMEKFKFVHEHCLHLLQKLDHIPLDLLVTCEKNIREKRHINKERSKQAVVTQNRFEMLTKQIKQQSASVAKFQRFNFQKSRITLRTKKN